MKHNYPKNKKNSEKYSDRILRELNLDEELHFATKNKLGSKYTADSRKRTA